MVRRADGRNDNGIDEGLRDGPLTGGGINTARRNIRKLKQVVVRLYIEGPREFSVAFRFTQFRTSFHLGCHPTAHQSLRTTRTGECSRAKDWVAGLRHSAPEYS